MCNSATIKLTHDRAPAWVAQCLEHDVSAQAADLETVRVRIEVAIEAEAPLADLPAVAMQHSLIGPPQLTALAAFLDSRSSLPEKKCQRPP